MRVRHLALIVLVLLFLVQNLYYYPILPSIMASHFDGGGVANGFASKNAFFLLEFVGFVLIAAEMALLPWLTGKMPDAFINLPNKAFWLAPDQRLYAFAKFKTYFQWFGVGLLTLAICVNQLVYNANLTRESLDQGIWVVLGLYLLFVVIWMIKFVRAFRIPL